MQGGLHWAGRHHISLFGLATIILACARTLVCFVVRCNHTFSCALSLSSEVTVRRSGHSFQTLNILLRSKHTQRAVEGLKLLSTSGAASLSSQALAPPSRHTTAGIVRSPLSCLLDAASRARCSFKSVR